jgi:chromosome segregation ATPase
MPSSPSDWDAIRAAAAAVIAQQSALFELELRLKERASALGEHEAQLSARLGDKRRQLDDIGRQIKQARDQHRQERLDADELHRQAEKLHQEAVAERERIRVLRTRFLQRMKVQRSTARNEIAAQKAELQRIRKQIDADASRLRRERTELEKSRQEMERERVRLRSESDRVEQETLCLNREREELKENLALRERAIANERQVLLEERRRLESELLDLERRRADALEATRPVSARSGKTKLALVELNPFASEPPAAEGATDGSIIPLDGFVAGVTDDNSIGQSAVLPIPLQVEPSKPDTHRLQLAELCERLTGTEHQWHAAQLDVVDEMERLAVELSDREAMQFERERELNVQADRLRQERQILGQLRDGIERNSAELMLRQWAWQAERNHTRGELDERTRLLDARESALPVLMAKWNLRRRDEVEQLRRLARETGELRRRLQAQSIKFRRRLQSLNDARRALAQQALALEQAKQEFLKEIDRPADVAARIEQLSHRLARRSAVERAEHESIRQHLDAEGSRLLQLESRLDHQAADLLRRERELNDRLNNLENEQHRAGEVAAAFDAARKSWNEQRRQYDLLLIDLRAEIDRLSRLTGGEVNMLPLRSAA